MPRVLIGLGGNVADPHGAIRLAWAALIEQLRLSEAQLSDLLWTAPAEEAAGPDFANAVGVGYTAASPMDTLRVLQRVELAFGRSRVDEGHHGSRPLDLDLLEHGTTVMNTATLTLPHPRMHLRTFVLMPLSQLLPGWTHLTGGQTVTEALRALEAS